MSDPQELFVRWELGQCDAADEAELAVLLRDTEQRRRFARHARVSLALSDRPVAAARRKQRRIVLMPVLWAAAASLLCAVGWWLGTSGPASAVAQVVASAGAQAQAADGTWRPLAAGDRLRAAETVSGQAVITLAGDSARLELDPGTRLRLPGGAALQLDLAAGRVQAEVAKRTAASPFSISSPQGEAVVVGTRFSFAADAASSRLAVTSGTVRLRATDGSEILVAAGQAGLGADGVVGSAPLGLAAEPPLPTGSRVLWRARPEMVWDGNIDRYTTGWALRSIPVADDRWAFAVVRSPLDPAGWRVAPATWLRFRYWTSGFAPEHSLVVHLKAADESNFAAILPPVANDGWHQAELRLDRDFHHRRRQHEAPAVGESLHGIIWIAQRVEDAPRPAARMWIADAVVYSVE